MDEGMLLGVAIAVFILMVIGLWLTVREFREHIIVEPSDATESPLREPVLKRENAGSGG